MQRRNVSSQSAASNANAAAASTPSRGGRTPGAGTHRPPATISTLVLLLIAASLTLALYLLPDKYQHTGRMEQQVRQTEQRVIDQALKTERSLEHELHGLWSPDDAASQHMRQQSSQWVDGEKKLKQKLKELAALQAQGKELGVPVATRWLGDDIPAWAGMGVDVDDWRKKVETRYTEMREQEMQWQKMVSATLQSQRG